MKQERYQLVSERELSLFEFISDGPNGTVTKLVQYSETNIKGVFNLGFGDMDSTTGEINDNTITNNGDSKKVLATVASTVYAFTDKYPDAMVFATGSNPARTRLYRMGISNNLSDIQKDFEVYGLKENEWIPFEKGTNYEAFLVKRKK